MIIEKLSQKYRCGCGKGLYEFESPGILDRLNLILEWDLCTDRSEDGRDYLEPGDVFDHKGLSGTENIVAVDSKDKLVLLVSETGPLWIERFVKELVDPEADLAFSSCDDVHKFSLTKVASLPEDLELFPVSFGWERLNILKERLLTKREIKENVVLEIELEHEANLYIPVKVWLTRAGWFYYNPSDLDADTLDSMVEDILRCMYQEGRQVTIPRLSIKDLEKNPVKAARILSEMTPEEIEEFVEYEGLGEEEKDLLIKKKDEILSEIEEKEEEGN